jgi:site-specific recombinase XerD
MNTSDVSRKSTLERDPMFFLEQNLKISNFSRKTVKSYLYYNKELLRFANYKSPKEINNQDIKDYLEFLLDSGKSVSTLNLAINAIKYYYKNLLNRKFFAGVDFKRPKREKKLPVVLSKEEIVRMIDLADNIKHKLVI